MPECSKCGKEFDTQQALNNHAQTHQSESPGGKVQITGTHLAVAGILVVLIGGGWFLFSGSSQQPTGAAAQNTGVAQQISNADDPVLGSSDASATIAYFGDYTCPSCRAFEQRAFPQLRRQVIDSGEAKFVKKNFPVITRQAPAVAAASQAVWSQVKEDSPATFWEWHAHIYDNQGREGVWATKERILELTGEIDGIDVEEVRSAMEQGTYRQEVDGDLNEGRQLGVRGTPTFIVYSEDTGRSVRIVGPQPVARFESAVNQVT